MANFDKGVDFYTFADLETRQGFPENEVKCRWCRYCKEEFGLKRHICINTHEMLYSIDTRGQECPLINFRKVEKGDK